MKKIIETVANRRLLGEQAQLTIMLEMFWYYKLVDEYSEIQILPPNHGIEIMNINISGQTFNIHPSNLTDTDIQEEIYKQL